MDKPRKYEAKYKQEAVKHAKEVEKMRLNKKLIIAVLSLSLLTNICSCDFEEETYQSEETENIAIDVEKKYTVNYGDAESFEKALNNGEKLEGQVVQFKVLDFKPDSAAGANIWAGEHLNFIISDDDFKVESGDVLTVMVKTIKKSLNSWFINFYIVDNYMVDENTIFIDSSTTSNETQNDVSSDKSKEETIKNPLLKYEHSIALLYERDNVSHVSYIIEPEKDELNGLTAKDLNEFIDNVSCGCEKSCNHEVQFAGLLFSDGTGIKLQIINQHLPCEYGILWSNAVTRENWVYIDISDNFKFYSNEDMTNLIHEGDIFDSNWFEILKPEGAIEPIYTEKVKVESEITQKQEATESPKVDLNLTQAENQHVDVPDQGDSISGGVWVPTNGGTKYHSKKGCSQMVDPVQISKDDAISRGYEACGRCW